MKNKYIKAGIILFFIISLSLFSLPQQDAKYFYINKYYKINNDGSWSLKYESKVKLNSYLAGRRLFGETFIMFNPKYQTLKILKSETTMKDGTKVPTPPNGYNPVLPYVAHNFPDFSYLREMVISHTGLERGATEELVYTVNTTKDFNANFFTEPLSEKVPVDKLTITFEIPKGKDFTYRIINEKITPRIIKGENSIRYIFEINNIDKSEYIYPYSIEDYPYLFVSFGNNLKQLEKLSEDLKLPNNLIKKIDYFKNNSSNNYDFLMKIQKYVSNDIQNANLGINITGIHIRNLAQIINSHYATPLEKTVLLFSLLKKYKFKPEIILFSTVKNFNILSDINKLFIKVNDKGKLYYLIPDTLQSKFYPYGYENWYPYYIGNSSYEKIANKIGNSINISGKIYLCTKKESKIILNTKGYFNDYRKLLNNEKSFINSVLNKTIGMKVKKQVKTILKSPAEFSAKIITKGSVFHKRYDKYFFLKTFGFPEISSIDSSVFYKSAPYNFKAPFKLKYEFEIIFPQNFKIEYLGKNVKIENSVGAYIREVNLKNNKIFFKLILKINKTKIKNKPLLKQIYDSLRADKDILVLIKN